MSATGAIYQKSEEELAFRRARREAVRLFPPQELDQVFDLYGVSEPQVISVSGFLTAHPTLVFILLEGRRHLQRIFGQAPAYLELERDPDGGPDELFAVIVAKTGPKEALALLERFDKEWFSRVARRTKGLLNFTVDTHDNEPV